MLILKIVLLCHFLQMYCMKRVLCINISRPEAKTYEYITYWLISSRILFQINGDLALKKRIETSEFLFFSGKPNGVSLRTFIQFLLLKQGLDQYKSFHFGWLVFNMRTGFNIVSAKAVVT